MFGDTSGLPVAGSAIAVGALYAGLNMFVTGPLIGERLVEKMDWAGQCARHITAEVTAAEPEASVIPRFDCGSTFGLLFGNEGQDFCAVHGDAFDNNPISELIGEAEAAERAAREQRMSWAASRADSRCDCAVSVTLEENRVDLALHAGSGRLIVPPAIRLLESDLVAALNTPACAMKG